MNTKLYQAIARTLQAMQNCQEMRNTTYLSNHEAKLDDFERWLPRGSGIDNGTKINRDASNGEKLCLTCSFHHMDSNGHYTHWSDYRVLVTGSLQSDFNLKVFGKNTNEILDYLHDTFSQTLSQVLQT